MAVRVMIRQPGRLRPTAGTVLTVPVALSVAACGLVGVDGPKRAEEGAPAAQVRAGAFGDRQVESVAELLERAGAGVVDGFGERGSRPVRLTRWQVRGLLAEAVSYHQPQDEGAPLASRPIGPDTDEHEVIRKPRLPDLSAARDLGSAETVRARWRQLLLVWRWHHERHEASYPGSAYPDIVSLIEAAEAEPELRQLYPFTSHFSLNFSSCTTYPWSVQAPSITPFHDGRFRVRRPRSSDVIGFAQTADAAAALAVDGLPAGLGPAVGSEGEGARDR
ncbi:DUF6193 family natural product biosynthesis protein [Actinocorallia populi]|uniref:DUF6193 family natural product biosynthesis protein n=1 Tax=Actinocorallia populi TaxID=2079200 RepID=UPI000D08E3A1|nr:DUF6193 family natural product biosynthesis protein [Actinocorallia populi]